MSEEEERVSVAENEEKEYISKVLAEDGQKV